MLFISLFFLITTSFAKPYVFIEFDMLKFFGSSAHKSHVEKAEQATMQMNKSLSDFYTTYYQYTNTRSNIISTTKFKRPTSYEITNQDLKESFFEFEKRLNFLFNESILKLESLEKYALPAIEHLPQADQRSYNEIKEHVYKSAQEHVQLIKHLYDSLSPKVQRLYSLISYKTKLSSQTSDALPKDSLEIESKNTIQHQPLSELRQREIESMLSELQKMQRVFQAIKASVADIHYSTNLIEEKYRQSLGKRFGYVNIDSFHRMMYQQVYQHLFDMYDSIKKDVSESENSLNRFVIKQYSHKLERLIDTLSGILTFTYGEIPEIEYRIIHELKNELKKKNRLLNQERSLYVLVGYLARYYNSQSDANYGANQCSFLFK